MNNFNEPATSTTTKTTITETHVQTNLRWDPSYIKSIPGALKLAAVVRKLRFLILKNLTQCMFNINFFVYM